MRLQCPHLQPLIGNKHHQRLHSFNDKR
jgi:hypothetical protein